MRRIDVLLTVLSLVPLAACASVGVAATAAQPLTVDVEAAGASATASSNELDGSVTIRVHNNLTPATRAFVRVEPSTRRADEAHQFGRRAGRDLGVVESGDTQVFQIPTPSFAGGYRLSATTGDRRTLLSAPLVTDEGTTIAWDMSAPRLTVRPG